MDIREIAQQHPILFYDGDCGLCSRIVVWVNKHDQKKQVYFCSIQSEKASQLLANFPLPIELDSIILLEKGKVTFEVKAVFHLLHYLPTYRIVGVFAKCIPLFMANWGCRLIAKNRKSFFKQQCVLNSELKSRIIG